MVDKIKQIKISRMKPEEIWFINLIENLTNSTSNKYPTIIYWSNNNGILFQNDTKNKSLWVDYFNIWIILKEKYNYKNSDTAFFIKNMLKKHLKWSIYALESVQPSDLNNIEY